MANDAFDKLSENKSSAGGDYASWWEPDEGEELIGIVVEKHAYTDPGGDDHPVGTVASVGRGDLQQGEERATPTHSNIEGFIGDTEIGDLVLLEYEGQVKANTGRDMNAYQTSRLRQEEWAETGQAELCREVWESSRYYDPVHDEAGAMQGDDSSDDGIPDEAVNFAEDTCAMNDDEMDIDELDDYLNDVRDYDVDPEEVVEASDALSLDDGTVQKD